MLSFPIFRRLLTTLRSFAAVCGLLIVAGCASKMQSATSAESSAATLPSFPWPPPQASATVVLPAQFFEGAGRNRDYADRLSRALNEGRYEYRYFGVPDGFAIVSRIERISDDGGLVEEDRRWSLSEGVQYRSLADFLRGVFIPPEGYFRVIVFVVTDTEFSQSPAAPTTIDALAWLRTGFNSLPEAVASAEVTSGTRCTALVYEFRGRGFDAQATVLQPGRFDARHHLLTGRVWPELARPKGP
jgi:hypothetical protein